MTKVPSLTIDQLSHYVGEIIFGTVFLLVGLVAVAIAVMRRGTGFRILIWLAVWSGMYGARLLILSPPIRLHFPPSFQLAIPYLDVSISYLIVVFALLAWLDLTRDKLRLFLRAMAIIGMALGLAGIGWFIATGVANAFMLYNSLLAASSLLVLLIVVTSRRLSEKFLVLPNRGVLAAGTLIFAAEALYSNLSQLLGYRTWPLLGWLGFAILLFSLAYAAGRLIFASERRLLEIENELETARQIQSSILPATVPELDDLHIVAAYHPATAVAGDFYDFLCVDSKRAGFLVADVSGHGVPAALIASMIKIATQSVVESAHDPAEVLRRLSRILGTQLRGQFVTAAYLYIDIAARLARYSAAGHPPLLYWDSAAQIAKPVESNGLLIGFSTENEYPVCEFTLRSGDRILLYTDGLTEAENADGEAFGDRRLHELLHSHENDSAKKFSASLNEELRSWQQEEAAQQDDVTWMIIDVR